MRGLLPGLPAGSGGRRRHVTVDVAVHIGIMGALVHLGLGPTVAAALTRGSTDTNRMLVECPPPQRAPDGKLQAGVIASLRSFKDDAEIAGWLASRAEPLPVYIVINVEAIRAKMQAIEDGVIAVTMRRVQE